MSYPRLQRRLHILLFFLWFQRALRLAIRIIWTGMAGYLIGWGINSIWGWLPDPRMWIALGITFASFSVIGIVFPIPQLSRITWQMDRRFTLDEQVSTAWQISQRQDHSSIAGLLVVDTIKLMPDIFKRIIFRGWFIGRDIISLLIVLVLFWLVFWNDFTVTPIELPEAQAELLPALGEDPSSRDIFPSGIPGLRPEESPNTDMSGQPISGDENDNLLSGDSDLAGDGGDLEGPLTALGERFSQQAVSYEVGQALQRGDFNKAADEIETLSDQVAQLSEESKQELSEAMKKASEDIDQTSGDIEEPIARNLAAASNALDVGSDSGAQKEMDQIASELRDLSKAKASQIAGQTIQGGVETEGIEEGLGQGGSEGGTSAGAREIGKAESFTRLAGEGETLELGEVSDLAGLLKPGIDRRDRGTDVTRGSLGSNTPGDSEVIDSILTPYYFSWEWRYVVATYFTPH